MDESKFKNCTVSANAADNDYPFADLLLSLRINNNFNNFICRQYFANNRYQKTCQLQSFCRRRR